jgi:uncharacterized membrane protein
MSRDPGEERGVERMLFFSDAVFAIAITLLVLELKVPPDEGTAAQDLGQTLLPSLPAALGFLGSFLLIGQTWIEHHRIGQVLVGADRGLLWWDLALLMFVAVMPFTTALVSEYFDSPLAVALYVAGIGALSLCKAMFWRHAHAHGFTRGDKAEIDEIGRRVWASPIVSAVVLTLALVRVPYVFVGFVLIPVMARLLVGRQRRGR